MQQAELVKTLAIIINGQKSYGKDANIADTFAYFKMKLEHRYTVSQVIHALGVYTDRHEDLPTPAGIISILSPEQPRISQAEFIHAKDQWVKEGYPSYSPNAMIVKQFEQENHEERAKAKPIEDKRVLEVIRGAVKKLA